MLESVWFFVDRRGNSPVKEFISRLPEKEQSKVRAYFMALKDKGHNLRRPLADYLGEGIYELRPKNNRIFYFFFLNNAAVILHGIRKKTDKIPSRDLELCIKRKQYVEATKNIVKIDL